MTQKTQNIIGWTLTIMVSLVLAASGVMKLIGGEETMKGAAAMGISAGTLKLIGLVEIGSMLLFILPRTAVLGTLLLAAYLGGAIATHIQNQQPIMMPVIIQSLVWIAALIRFPELSRRITGKAIA